MGGQRWGKERAQVSPLEEQQQQGEKGKGEKKFSKTNMGRSRSGGRNGRAGAARGVTLRSTRLILELRDGGTDCAASAPGCGGVARAGGVVISRGRGQEGVAPLFRC